MDGILEKRRFPYKKVVISLILGILGFALSKYAFKFSYPPFELHLQLSFVFPMIAAGAYGYRYGLLAGIIGLGAAFPFILWPSNGWANFVTMFIYLFWFVYYGKVSELYRIKRKIWLHPYISMFPALLVSVLAYRLLYPIGFSLNPPFWMPSAENFMSQEIINSIIIKECVVLPTGVLIATIALKIKQIRLLLGLPTHSKQDKNLMVFITSILSGFGIWIVFMIFNRIFVSQSFSKDFFTIQSPYEIIGLFVFFFAGLLIASLSMSVSEKRSLMINNLKSSEQQIRSISNNFHSGMIYSLVMYLDGKRKFTYVGETVKTLYGVTPEEVYKDPDLIYSRIHPDDVEQLLEAEKEGLMKFSTFLCEARMKNPDGSYRWSLFMSSPTKQTDDSSIWNGVETVITEKKRLEEKEKHLNAHFGNQQKLESIGVLASGVAHEINNPLNGVMNYAQLILDSTDSKKDEYLYAKEIIHETDRISKIVKNLLQFSRHESEVFHTENIQDILDRTLSLVKTLIKKDQIDIIVSIEEGLPEIACRKNQIQQVIMNLMTNAQYALNQKYKGYDPNKKIIITAEKIQKTNEDYIRLTIQDNGTGIPFEIQKKIFDPFFSSKGRVEGTGLGLSISYGIIKEHQGELNFETKAGEYTKFYIDLPCERL